MKILKWVLIPILVAILTTAERSKKMRDYKIYCPANGWDCPYYKLGECGINDPMAECDDFGAFWDEEDDYQCYDEKRTAFEP